MTNISEFKFRLENKKVVKKRLRVIWVTKNAINAILWLNVRVEEVHAHLITFWHNASQDLSATTFKSKFSIEINGSAFSFAVCVSCVLRSSGEKQAIQLRILRVVKTHFFPFTVLLMNADSIAAAPSLQRCTHANKRNWAWD